MCVALSKLCDGRADCTDGTDEKNCDHWQKVYQVDGISVNPEGIEAHEIKIEWWVSLELRSAAGSMKFLPAICEIKSGHCTNHTTWITDSKFTFHDLNPFTRYSVTVYVLVNNTTYPPSVYKIVNTIEYGMFLLLVIIFLRFKGVTKTFHPYRTFGAVPTRTETTQCG